MSEVRDPLKDDSAAAGPAGSLAEAQEQLEAGRPVEAARILESLVQREPGNAAAHQELATALVRLSRHGAAVQAARRALELDLSLARPHGVLAWVAMNRGRHQEAEAELRAQLQALPAGGLSRRAAAHNQLGLLYFRQRRYPDAEQALQQALALEPERSIPRWNLALLYLQTRRREEAQRELERLLTLPEMSPEVAHTARFNLGHLYACQGRYADAREQFAQALTVHPTFLGRFYRTVPFLARFSLRILIVALLLILLLAWNLFLRRR